MDYYKTANRFTEIRTEKWIVSEVKNDMDFLFDIIKSILIHPRDASKAKVKYDRAHNGVFHAFNTTAEQILKYEKLAPYLREKRLPLNTKPEDRAVLSCDHHALLFTSFMRCLGVPARARTGFAKYIVDGLNIPHWIAEVYDENTSRWKLVDPERRIINVDRDAFLFAGQAWEFYFNHPEQYHLSYSGLTGKQGLKYALISDLNCIFKCELLGYEWRLKSFGKKKPDFVRTSYERMDSEQQAEMHRIARLMENPDENVKALWELYLKDIGAEDARPPDFMD